MIPVADGLFTWPSDQPQLIGAHFPASGVTTFPYVTSCPKTSSTDVHHVLLPRRGTLWSWTIQAFLPKNPPYAGRESAGEFVPYGVGYVLLGDEVLVESRLTMNQPDQISIGMELELVIVPFTTNDAGQTVVTYAFAPASEGTS